MHFSLIQPSYKQKTLLWLKLSKLGLSGLANLWSGMDVAGPKSPNGGWVVGSPVRLAAQWAASGAASTLQWSAQSHGSDSCPVQLAGQWGQYQWRASWKASRLGQSWRAQWKRGQRWPPLVQQYPKSGCWGFRTREIQPVLDRGAALTVIIGAQIQMVLSAVER